MASRMSVERTTPDGVTVAHPLIVQEQPRGLLVILPGRGYTCDHPVLHYLRKAAADLGWDVLSLWYGFQVTPIPDEQVTLERLAEEVDDVIAEVSRRGYDQVCIAGKSLGTLLAVRYAPQADRLILLTPIGTSVFDVGDAATLAVVGTQDSVYQPDVVSATPANVHWLVLDGLDHGLEAAGDWARSLAGLEQVTRACAAFLS